MFFVYIVYNKTIDKYYTGYSSNLNRRIIEHNKPFHKNKYTRKQEGKWELVYYEKYHSRKQAMRREKEIKSWKSRKRIEKLIKQSR